MVVYEQRRKKAQSNQLFGLPQTKRPHLILKKAKRMFWKTSNFNLYKYQNTTDLLMSNVPGWINCNPFMLLVAFLQLDDEFILTIYLIFSQFKWVKMLIDSQHVFIFSTYLVFLLKKKTKKRFPIWIIIIFFCAKYRFELFKINVVRCQA